MFNLASVRAASSKLMPPLAIASLLLCRSWPSFKRFSVASCESDSLLSQENWLEREWNSLRAPGFNLFGSIRSKQTVANVSSVGVRFLRVVILVPFCRQV